VSRLDLVVGPNGAGKSTFVRQVLRKQQPNTPFVNADDLARILWPENPSAHSYDAAQAASSTRDALIASGVPFIAETVFSHRSKLKLVDRAKNAGYFIALHVLLVPQDMAVERVAFRVTVGGHAVPEQKIRERYDRLWDLVAEAGDKADSTTFRDNSTADGPQTVARLIDGCLLAPPKWPVWTPAVLTRSWT